MESIWGNFCMEQSLNCMQSWMQIHKRRVPMTAVNLENLVISWLPPLGQPDPQHSNDAWNRDAATASKPFNYKIPRYKKSQQIKPACGCLGNDGFCWKGSKIKLFIVLRPAEISNYLRLLQLFCSHGYRRDNQWEHPLCMVFPFTIFIKAALNFHCLWGQRNLTQNFIS